MNTHVNVYKKNMAVNKPLYQKAVDSLQQGERFCESILTAIDDKNIEQRYVYSEKLIKLLVELHDMFDNHNDETVGVVMQRYCVQNINLVGKLNLKNDRELAIALRESFFEISNMWLQYKFNFSD
jgi:flagellin-specific chaperone FliS